MFTDRPLTGNQLGVFLDAQGLDADVMQRIALEMAFSETTFVFPAAHPGTAYRVRIFTTRTELPMAGHRTIGTTFALAHPGRITKASASVTLGLGSGPTPVGLEWRGDQLDFAWMTQPIPQFGRRLEDVRGIYNSLRQELVTRLQGLTANDWAKTAEHDEYNSYSMFTMMRHLALHDFFHAYRIEELLLRKDWPRPLPLPGH